MEWQEFEQLSATLYQTPISSLFVNFISPLFRIWFCSILLHELCEHFFLLRTFASVSCYIFL